MYNNCLPVGVDGAIEFTPPDANDGRRCADL